MSFTDLFKREAPDALHCPFCRIKLVPPVAKRLSSTYMRCDSCGQLWHPDRLQTTHAVNRGRR